MGQSLGGWLQLLMCSVVAKVQCEYHLLRPLLSWTLLYMKIPFVSGTGMSFICQHPAATAGR